MKTISITLLVVMCVILGACGSRSELPGPDEGTSLQNQFEQQIEVLRDGVEGRIAALERRMYLLAAAVFGLNLLVVLVFSGRKKGGSAKKSAADKKKARPSAKKAAKKTSTNSPEK